VAKRPAGKKSERTREQVLDTALKLFRRRGFDATTMRDIAAACGLSLGAAYYYFDSKDAILFAYYARNREAHRARAAARLVGVTDMAGRLGAIAHAGLDVVERERKMLAALLSRLADPSDPISAFSAAQREIRNESIAMFASAFDSEPFADDLRPLLGPAAWLLYMAVLLYFVRDDSPGQARTRRLVDDAIALLVPALALLGSPFAQSLRAQLHGTLERAGLFEAIADASPGLKAPA
jgi:AcrR family transcriptional regulator